LFFFSRNNVFLSQQISRNSISAYFFSETNGAMCFNQLTGARTPSFISFLLSIHHTIKRIGSWSVIYSYKLGLLHAFQSLQTMHPIYIYSEPSTTIYCTITNQKFVANQSPSSCRQTHADKFTGVYSSAASGISLMVSTLWAARCLVLQIFFSSG